MTTNTRVSHCANPKCDAEFKRLGQGKLFIQPSDPADTTNGLRQKVIWLCSRCARHFEVRFDQSRKTYSLVSIEQVA
jgi:hypothetical protein